MAEQMRPAALHTDSAGRPSWGAKEAPDATRELEREEDAEQVLVQQGIPCTLADVPGWTCRRRSGTGDEYVRRFARALTEERNFTVA